MIDLHTHSTNSDGSYTPTQLVEAAEDAGLTAIALTDHDSTEGLAEFLAAGRGKTVKCIPGVEISANFEPGTMHILGFFMDLENEAMQNSLLEIRDGRNLRNRRIIAKLVELGVPVEWDEVKKKAGGDVMGRPHIAKVMLDKGYVGSIKETFEKYLAKGKPAYVDRFRLSPEEGIKQIRDAGGVAVLSHPSTLQLDRPGLRKLVMKLADAGLHGLEAYYPEHTDQEASYYASLAGELGMLCSGGTDFHGDLNPNIKLGRGFGPLKVPDRLLADICAVAGVEL